MLEVSTEMSAQTVRFFGNHRVDITCWDRTLEVLENEPHGHFMNFSAFVVSVNDIWFVMTAGHVLKSLESLIEQGHILEEWTLDDTLGSNVKSDIPIPFPVPHMKTLYVADDECEIDPDSKHGADYGLIEVPPFYRRLLGANNIVPFSETAWRIGMPDTFDRYMLAGVPTEGVSTTLNGAVNKGDHLLGLTLLNSADVPPELTRSSSGVPRMYFSLPSNGPDSIIGMSGGPILGFKVGDDGSLRYWLVGVQSAVAKHHPITIACPIDVFLEWIDAQLATPGIAMPDAGAA